MNHGYKGKTLIKRKSTHLAMTLGMLACAVDGAVGNH